jgi:tetratricopeptide (TPR) repeat protein
LLFYPFCSSAQNGKILVVLSKSLDPIEGATIRSRTGGEVFFTDPLGKSRVFIQEKDTIDISHVAFLDKSVQSRNLRNGDTIILDDLVYSIREVSISYNHALYYKKINNLLTKIRKIESKKARNYYYSLETSCEDTLFETSSGIVNAKTTARDGFEKIDFVAANYGLSETSPFINTDFTKYCHFFKLFRHYDAGRFMTPLNEKKINKENTEIKLIDCSNCAPHTILLDLVSKKNPRVSVTISFDTSNNSINTIRYTISDQAQYFFRAIVPEHSIDRIKFDMIYYFGQDNSIISSYTHSVIDYTTDRRKYEKIHLRLMLRLADPRVQSDVFFFGEPVFQNDVERIIIAPSGTFRPLDLPDKNRFSPGSMAANVDVVSNKQLTAEVLNILKVSDLYIWADSFYSGAVNNTEEFYDVSRGNYNEEPQASFAFGWVFSVTDSARNVIVNSPPSFIDRRKTFFLAESKAKAIVYYNILLDYVEIKRRKLLSRLIDIKSREQILKTISTYYTDLVAEISGIHFYSKNGNNLRYLNSLNDLIKEELGKDNFASWVQIASKEDLSSTNYSYADILAITGDYEGAINLYNQEVAAHGYTNLEIIANRIECYMQTGRQEEACKDYQYLLEKGYKIQKSERFSHCN